MTTGIKAAVVRALVALYEEPKKPDNALGYLACFMGADLPTEEDVKGKLEEIRTMRERVTFCVFLKSSYWDTIDPFSGQYTGGRE